MPNWCNNYLEVYFDINNPTQVAYVKAMKAAADSSKLLNFLKPMPKHQPDLTKPNPFYAKGSLGSDTERIYGKDNCWYHWSINNWGTKWDVDGSASTLSDGLLAISFDSAWSPPTEAIKVLKDLGYGFRLWYHEPGMNFYGELTPDTEVSESVDFEPKLCADYDKLQKALEDMVESVGIDSDFVEMLGLTDCYYNEDYEDDEDDDSSNDTLVEGA